MPAPALCASTKHALARGAVDNNPDTRVVASTVITTGFGSKSVTWASMRIKRAAVKRVAVSARSAADRVQLPALPPITRSGPAVRAPHCSIALR